MYKRIENEWAKHLDFMILDLLGFQAAYILSYLFLLRYAGHANEAFYLRQSFVFFMVQMVVCLVMQPYTHILRRSHGVELQSVVNLSAVVMVLDVIYLFIIKETYIISRVFFLVLAVLAVLVMWIFRTGYKKHLQAKKSVKSRDRALVIFTYSHMADEVVSGLLKDNYNYFKINGIYLLDKKKINRSDIQGIPLIDTNKSLFEAIGHEWVDEAFFFLSPEYLLPKCYVDTLLKMGITIHFSYSSYFEEQGIMQKTDKIGSYYVFTNSLKIVNASSMALKRVFDIIGGLVGCFLTAIIFVFIAPIIYIQSPGPIFFSQWRVGKNGRKFKIYKFRSMYMDAEERKKEYMAQNKINGLMFKMDDDPRIIGSEKKDKNGRPKGIGNFIRRTSLDEFPQFWNVLIGDMSLVGTRPPTVDEWEQYDVNHRVRMCVKPGITGVWQVSGRSKITDFNEVVKLDASYVRDWNILLDIKIILKTVQVVLRNDGAV
ncbi:MAG: sugar transferase [Solobacterium sp.]|nr:sugar transferase [Solobacterium sp.]